MKKHILLIAAMLFTLAGVQANVLQPSDINTGKAYHISCERGALTAASATATKLSGTSEDGVNQALDPKNPLQQFAFIAHGEDFYLYNVGTGKFVSPAGLSEHADTPILFADADDATVRLLFDDNHNINLGGSQQYLCDTWFWKDAGNSFVIKEAIDFDQTAIAATITDPYTYVIVMQGAPNGATVKIDGKSYGHGAFVETYEPLTEDDIDAARSGYVVVVTIEDGVITVKYIKRDTSEIDFSKSVYIRDASTTSHGSIHYWTNTKDTYLGWTTEGMDDDACRWNLIPAGEDSNGNALYYVQHTASGLFVEGLKFITDEDPDESNVLTPLVATASEAHSLTFIALDNGHYYICDTHADEANGYRGGDGYYNYAMCGNYENVGGYYRDYDYGADSYGLVTFACEWEVAPAPKGDDSDVTAIPEGEEVYIALIPGWINYGEYLWTSDGGTAGLVHLDKERPQRNDFAAAAFIKVPTTRTNYFKLYHIQSRKYLYGLNFIADSPDNDPTNVNDGDPWDNRCVLTSDESKAHALRIDQNYKWTTESGSRTYDFKAKGWYVINDPVVEKNPGDGCHYYGTKYGYCVFMLYPESGYQIGGFGAMYCPSQGGYMPDPWIIRTPHEMSEYLNIPEIPSMIPEGIERQQATTAGQQATTYDLQGRHVLNASSCSHGLYIQSGKKILGR